MNFQAYTIPTQPEWACIHLHAPSTQQRTPVHLVCIIDTSASMENDNKLVNVKHSLQYLLNFLTPLDYISIITFSEKTNIIVKQHLITSEEKQHIQTRISFITQESVTNLSSAIVDSRSSLFKDTSSIKQGILLLTDGHANAGIIHPDDICMITQKTLDLYKGTSISCIGYGTDHNVNLLQRISTEGGGAYYVVNNLDHVASVFGDILGGLVSCSYQQISISLPKDTLIKTRYSIHNSSDEINILIGDLPADMDAIFLAKLPTQHPLIMKAYDLTQHAFITMEITIKTTDNPQLQNNAIAHYVRFQVLSLIDQVLQFTKKQSEVDPESISSLKKNKLINNINDYITLIQQYSVTYSHSLWDILLKELEYCKYYFENRKDCCEDWQSLMSQHNLCLGLMRGISSGSSQSQDVIPGGLPPHLAPTLSNHFSSPLQRQFSEDLKDTVLSQSSIRFKKIIEVYTQEDSDENNDLDMFAPPSTSNSNTLLSTFQFNPLPSSFPSLHLLPSGSYTTLPPIPSLERQHSYHK